MRIDNTAHSAILPGEGVTAAERRLAKLGKRSFLSVWSYPAVFRDQGRKNGKGDGKEVCDPGQSHEKSGEAQQFRSVMIRGGRNQASGLNAAFAFHGIEADQIKSDVFESCQIV